VDFRLSLEIDTAEAEGGVGLRFGFVLFGKLVKYSSVDVFTT